MKRMLCTAEHFDTKECTSSSACAQTDLHNQCCSLIMRARSANMQRHHENKVCEQTPRLAVSSDLYHSSMPVAKLQNPGQHLPQYHATTPTFGPSMSPCAHLRR